MWMWGQQQLKENNMLNSFGKILCSVVYELTQMI